MQELAWLAEIIRLASEGAPWEEIKSSQGFLSLLILGVVLVPSSLIALGIGTTEWHETPLGRWFGAREPEADDWKSRACDLDKDGTPDF